VPSRRVHEDRHRTWKVDILSSAPKNQDDSENSHSPTPAAAKSKSQVGKPVEAAVTEVVEAGELAVAVEVVELEVAAAGAGVDGST
jgi:hypothetical protein